MSTIYGQTEVSVQKDRDGVRWVVSLTDGRVLVAIPWFYAFDQSSMWRERRSVYGGELVSASGDAALETYREGHWCDRNLASALDACMSLQPLTDEEIAFLKTRYRLQTERPTWHPLRDVWEPAFIPPPIPTPRASRPMFYDGERLRPATDREWVEGVPSSPGGSSPRERYSAPTSECSTPSQEVTVVPDPERKLLV